MNYTSVNSNSITDKAAIEIRKISAEEHFKNFLLALGFDLNDPNMSATPRRVTDMYMDELFKGVWQKEPEITAFKIPSNSLSKEMIVVGPMVVKSMCAHHLLPIYGSCWMGIILPPNSVLPGLSKYARIVDFFARRPQTQEQLTKQIHDYWLKLFNLSDNDARGGIQVVVRAKHACMSHRGVNETNSNMTTSALSGVFLNPAVRQEFFALANING